ncbi:response regulator [Halogeometricum salsisoli]|uniref:response regulator n=1 Tax=Halogeometricum salsisoli TaxID=2950536 RepID=UPI003CCDBB79
MLETRTDATVRRVRTESEALAAYRNQTTDCFICAYELDDATGLQTTPRNPYRNPTLPVILGASTGNEAIASEAIGAGVTDYVALTDVGDQMISELLDRTERTIRSAQRSATREERARQFDAIFNDSRTATWVLDPDGSLVRVNQTAQEMSDEDIDVLVGELFWTLPWLITASSSWGRMRLGSSTT